MKHDYYKNWATKNSEKAKKVSAFSTFKYMANCHLKDTGEQETDELITDMEKK